MGLYSRQTVMADQSPCPDCGGVSFTAATDADYTQWNCRHCGLAHVVVDYDPETGYMMRPKVGGPDGL